jgi:hypothetical protein
MPDADDDVVHSEQDCHQRRLGPTRIALDRLGCGVVKLGDVELMLADALGNLPGSSYVSPTGLLREGCVGPAG